MVAPSFESRAIDRPCPACGERALHGFYAQHRVPVNQCALMHTREQATAIPRGELELAVCHACAFVTNVVFDGELVRYDDDYEETQGFSPTFRAFQERLARDLVDRYRLDGRLVLEIGCGKGDFLVELLRAAPRARAVAVDPGLKLERIADDVRPRVRGIKDAFRIEHGGDGPDFICCRHTLEHVPAPRDLVATAAEMVRGAPDWVVWFEIPDVLRVLREGAFWDLYYEHCSYFTLGSLGRLFRSCGLGVLELTTVYDDQYLIIGAAAGRGRTGPAAIEDDVATVRDAVGRFAEQCRRVLGGWDRELARIAAAGGRAVIWGAGSKGAAFLGALDASAAIACAVDVNPHKHGRFMPGTGHRVAAPAELRQLAPTHVIPMNPVYADEIARDLAALGVDAQVCSINDPPR